MSAYFIQRWPRNVAQVLCEYYAPWADVYNSCFMAWREFAWTRRVARLYIRGYGKTGRLRPRTCMCRPFQNVEIVRRVSLPSYATPTECGVARKWVTKSRDSSKSSRIGGKRTNGGPGDNSSPSKYRFYAIDSWRNENEKRGEKSPPAVHNCRASSPVCSLRKNFYHDP